MRLLPTTRWWIIGPLAACWAATIGLVVVALPVAIGWATSGVGSSSWAQPIRITGLSWVVAHDVAVRIDAATYSLLPWGMLVVWGLLLGWAGRWAARVTGVRDLRTALILSGEIAGCYAAVLAGVSALTADATVRTSPLRALGIGLVLAAFAAGWGVVREAGLVPQLRARIPVPARVVVRAAAAGTVALLGFGAAVLAVSLAANLGQARQIQAFIDPGVLGGAVLLIVSLGYLPTAIMWSTSYLLGAGLSLGGASVLTPFVTTPAPTQLPPLPLLAALPQQATLVSWALPALGVVAGIVSGLVVVRSARFGALGRMAAAVAAAVVSALVLAVLARMSFGSLGGVRLVSIGPPSQLVALLAGGTMIIGSVPTALAGRRRVAEAEVPGGE